MNRCLRRTSLVTALLFLAASASLFAQEGRGTIAGTVVDALGGVLPGASVKVTEVSKNKTESTVTNAEGRYEVKDLPAGAYLVTVELPGFAKAVRDQVRITGSETRDVPFTLAIGSSTESVTVTGFRESLQQAVDLKREAVNTRESIVAEDIGKMPDLNLAEAIQRVPAVAIDRQGGEGRQVSLRGLGPNFTRVTLNGMEVPASTSGLDSVGGTNRGRAFDFNVFSADLFTRIDITKTPTAGVEEGGVAGTVELYTARPLDNPGFHSTFSAQGGYNDLSKKSDPRLTGTVSKTNAAGTFGALFSAAYTGRTAYQDGFGTVRWAIPDRPFRANGTSLSTTTLNTVFYPRLPRQDSFRHVQDRLGLSGALQFRPTNRFELGVNWVRSKFDATINSYNSFAEFRRSGAYGYQVITPRSVTLDSKGQYAIAGNFDGVGLRTETRENDDSTVFDQVTVDGRFNLSNHLILTAMGGTAQSKHTDSIFRANIETRTGTNFSYDFSANPNVASIKYNNYDVTNPANYTILDDEQLRRFKVNRKNNTARLDLKWFVDSGTHVVNFGGIYNDREVDATQGDRPSLDPRDVAALTRVFNFVDAGNYGSATTLDFLVLDVAKAIPAFGSGAYVVNRGPGIQTWTVQEKTQGAYVDYNLKTQVGGHGFRSNLGVRYVNTKTETLGYLSATLPNKEGNSYNDLLPAVNIAFDATSNLVLRAAASRTMTRADLSSLVPTKTYSDVNFSVAGGNSQLKPLRADAFDVAAEWYFADQGVFAASLFYKDIKSFISSPRISQPLRPEDYPAVRAVYPSQPQLLDPSLTWTYSTSGNVDGTNLKGFEVAYQQALKFLPGLLKNLGVIANYSYVDAKTTTLRNNASVVVPLEGMSKNSWNATVYYEVKKYAARVSVNKRDDYITSNTGQNGNLSEGTTGPIRYDMSAAYHFSDRLSLTLEGVNLTNETERLFTTGDGSLNLVREFNTSGRQFFFGVRAHF
jgi:iron complex outermembrane receptor protein